MVVPHFDTYSYTENQRERQGKVLHPLYESADESVAHNLKSYAVNILLGGHRT